MKRTRRLPVFHVFLVRPSKYDDEGFVIRHWLGVVPSNSLACLYGLTEDVRLQRLLGDVRIQIHVLDETVTQIPLGRIARLNRRAAKRVLVCLVGVQTNQFCRAADIALTLRREGVKVMIGGFHVSGTLAMFPTVSPEIQQLVDTGVSVVAGEVEHRWGHLLRDAYEGHLKPIYGFLGHPPNIYQAPCPIKSKESRRRFFHSNYGTLDCSRGCPFNCSFCTIVNVQGRKTRYRSPQCIIDTIRLAYQKSGVNLYFFTDDNFSRNPVWEAIFDGLLALREYEGIAVEFVLQVDISSYKIPGFIQKAAGAGCCSVFIGMESMNPENLQIAGKTQNHVQEYKLSLATWHDARVTTFAGYIIGFPRDSEESVRQDIERLISEVQPDVASFTVMTPLPGSRDQQKMCQEGTLLESDYNRFDCCQETMQHPHMKDGAWTRAYRQAWRRFYGVENMKAVLSRTHPEKYWDVFTNLLWYKNSLMSDDMHPMMAGFIRLKDRHSRRACFGQQTRIAHLRRRIPEIYRCFRGTLLLMLQMEELWLATRPRSETERLILKELALLGRRPRTSDIHAAYVRAAAHMPSIEIPSRLRLFWDHGSLLRVSRLLQTRRDLARFWIGFRRRLCHGQIGTLLRVDQIALNALREICVATGFLKALIFGKS